MLYSNPQDQFIHPKDKSVRNKIYQSDTIKQIMDYIFSEGLDEINTYVYRSSYVRLPKNHKVWNYLDEGRRLFKVNESLDICLRRDYNLDVKCTGYNHPVILLPDSLLKAENDEILRIRVMAVAAAVRAEHHKLDFLVWFLEHTGGQINKFFIGPMLERYLLSWKRASNYTTDRAAFIACQNEEIAFKNILFGKIPKSELEKFDFGVNGTFSGQTKEFFSQNGLMDIASSLYGAFQLETWLPKRYYELQKFITEQR